MTKVEDLSRKVSELKELLAKAEEDLMDAVLEELVRKDRDIRDADLRPCG